MDQLRQCIPDLRDYSGALTVAGIGNPALDLHPGECILAELAAGGRVTFAAPGETIVVRLLQGTWVHIYMPPEAAVRTAADGIDA